MRRLAVLPIATFVVLVSTAGAVSKPSAVTDLLSSDHPSPDSFAPRMRRSVALPQFERHMHELRSHIGKFIALHPIADQLGCAEYERGTLRVLHREDSLGRVDVLSMRRVDPSDCR